MNKSKCGTCGFEWVTGRDGTHSCATILVVKLKNANHEIGDLKGNISKLKTQRNKLLECATSFNDIDNEHFRENLDLKKTIELLREDVPVGSKYRCNGEFFVSVEMECPECGFDIGESDDDCEICGGEVTYTQPFVIPWTTIKDIYKAMKPLQEK